MNACVLCVGKLKESWQRDACAEYLLRLQRFGRVEIAEVPDLPEPAKPSPALEIQVMAREGEALLRRIRPTDRVIALCIRGDAPDSLAFADQIARWQGDGRRLAFVIGGSLGLSDAVLARADHRISMSKLTFPHALARVMLLEQLYRAAKIVAGERYHK